MADLNGQTIANTYSSLLKFSDNGVIEADAVQVISDGRGTATSLWLSTLRASIVLGSTAGDDFKVDGTTLVVEGDNNRVGIGTAAPDCLLHLVSSVSNKPTLRLQNISGTADDEGGNIVFTTSDGAIGATTNLTDNDILGDIVFQGVDASDDASIAGAQIRCRINGTPGTNDMPAELAFYTNAGADSTTQKMCIMANGNVGIGETGPDTPLHISANTDPTIRLCSTDTSINSAGGEYYGTIEWETLDSSDPGVCSQIRVIPENDLGDASMLFNVGEAGTLTTAMYIKNDGTIGINKNTPAYPLDVMAADGSSSYVRAVRTDGTAASIIIGATSGHTRLYSRDAGTGNMGFAIQIGTTDRLAMSTVGVFTGSASADISDERLKKNIQSITGATALLKQLEGRTFEWKQDVLNDSGDIIEQPQGRKWGLIAQEVEGVIPDLIEQSGGMKTPDGNEYYKHVSSAGVIPILIEAIKELSAKVTALENA